MFNKTEKRIMVVIAVLFVIIVALLRFTCNCITKEIKSNWVKNIINNVWYGEQ